MANAADYMDDVKRYDAGADQDAIQKIVNYLGVALLNKDASLVSCSDETESSAWIPQPLKKQSKLSAGK